MEIVIGLIVLAAYTWVVGKIGSAFGYDRGHSEGFELGNKMCGPKKVEVKKAPVKKETKKAVKKSSKKTSKKSSK